MHAGALLPLLILGVNAITVNLGFNPIQTATRLTGRAALVILLLSLTVTPICKLFNLPQIAPLRRDLGLYAFKYALLHLAIYIVWDYGFDWAAIFQSMLNNRFVQIGTIAFIILLLLTITSFPFWIRKLGKSWKWLHRLVYLAAFLVLLHFAWVDKGNIFSAQGDFVRPLIALGAFLLLMLLRIRPVINFLRGLAQRRNSKENQVV